MSEVISFETALELFVQNYRKKQLEEIRKGFRLDEENWKTINGNHVLIDSDTGEIKVGPKALKDAVNGKISGAASDDIDIESGLSGYQKYGKTASERLKNRYKTIKDCREKLSDQHNIVKMRWEIMKSKMKYVRQFDFAEEKYQALDGVTPENLEEKTKKAWDKVMTLKAKYDKAYQNGASESKLHEIEKEHKKALSDYEVLKEYEESKEKLEKLKEDRKPFDAAYKLAKKEFEDSKQESLRIIEEYNKERDAWNREILKKYPSYDAIKTDEDASEYLTAKGYFDAVEKEDPRRGIVEGEPRVSGADLHGMMPEIAVETCKTVDSIYEKYPELTGVVSGFDTQKDLISIGALGEYGGGVLNIDADTFSDLDKRNFGGYSLSSTRGATQMQKRMLVLAHEFGHAMDEYLSEKYNDISEFRRFSDGVFKGTRETVGPPILRTAAKNLGIKQSELQKRISTYACKNPMEGLAEAFCVYAIFGGQDTEIKEIGRQIDSLCKTGKLVGKEK